jgi:hypothetical protein
MHKYIEYLDTWLVPCIGTSHIEGVRYMAIHTRDIGNHTVEIDTHNGMLVIYGTGTRLSLSLREASKMLSEMLLIVNPSSMLESEHVDTLDISAIGNSDEKIIRILTHAKYLTQRHLQECANCRHYLINCEDISNDTLINAIVTCISKSEGIKPYLTRFISPDMLVTVVTAEYEQYQRDSHMFDDTNIQECSNILCGYTSETTKLCEFCGRCFLCTPIQYHKHTEGK